MGFEMESIILSYFNSNFAKEFLVVYLKIFTIFFIYLNTLEVLISSLQIDKHIHGMVKIFIFTVFILLSTISTIIFYPQLFSDFFYGKHPYLLPILYFFTDYINPDIPIYTLYLLLFNYLIFNLIKYVQLKEIKYFYIQIYLIFFMIFHLRNDLIGLIIFFIFFKLTYHIQFKINKFIIITFYFLMIILSFSFYYYEQKLIFPSDLDSNKKTNIILISADSLRKDTIGKIRNNKSITPNIDRFKDDSFNFNDHHTTIPRTFPSWADLLTGSYSMSHQVRDMFPAPSEAANIGSKEFPTLPQFYSKNGYSTSVFSNFAGDIFPRANFGFEIVETPDFNAKVLMIQKSLEPQIFLMPLLSGIFSGGQYFDEIHSFSNFGDGKQILNKMKPYLRLNSKKNLFTTVFFSVTHFPYSPPYPFYKVFTPADYKGIYKYFKFVDPTNDSKPTEEDIEQIKNIFDSSILSFDNSFGELIDHLKLLNLYDESLIILTGDHGETLYEEIHGHGHGEHLRGENVTNIPLIIKFPKSKLIELPEGCKTNFKLCNTFNGITTSIDIFPTLLNFSGFSYNHDIPGRSLIPILGKEKWEDDRKIYTETGIWFSDIGEHFFQKQRIHYPNILELHRVVPEHNYQIMITDRFFRETIAFSKHRGILSSDYKFLYIPTHDGVVYEFYDRINDPLNTKNLFPNNKIEIFKKELHQISQKWESSEIISDYILPPPIEKD
jgi:hypothetical protein